MKSYKIGVIVGSLRQDSINRKLAKAMIKLAPAEFKFQFLEIGNLPLYNQDHDTKLSTEVVNFKGAIKACDALIFATPEYNRGMPGVLKNALDCASRPWGDNTWSDKPAGIVGISVGAIGTAPAQQNLRAVLSYLNVHTLCQPEAYLHAKDGFFDAKGDLGLSETKAFLQNWIDSYVAWVKKHVG